MSTTCSCGSCALSCTDHAHYPLSEQREDYWSTPAGISRRIKFLAQDFTYKTVNGAMKIYGETQGVKWMKWLTVGDDRVCIICERASMGGRNGYYKVQWFMPQMPAHAGCRCQWTVYYETPVEQTTLS